MRATTAFILTAALAVSLAGCAAPGASTTTGDCSTSASGSASSAVKVTGDFGAKPAVDFTEPLSSTATERSVVIPGKADAAVASDNDLVTLDFTLYNATTGTLLTATDYTGAEKAQLFYINESQSLRGLVKTVKCATVGSRVVGVIPPVDAFGTTGSTDFGIAADDSLIFVADVVAIDPGYATGTTQAPKDGLPVVTLNKQHEPTVTIPKADPPADLQLEVLKQGDGAVVGDGDTVLVQYYGINWNTGAVFDQSWTKSGPTSFATTGVVKGFSEALVGQKAGSQVLVVIPPALGYGPSGGTPDGTIGKNDTIVFVVDILATSPTK